MPPSLLRLLLGVGLFLGERADVINQVPVLFFLNTLTFGRHVFVAVLDDLEDLAVSAVFERGRIGEVGNREFHVLGGFAFAVAHGAIERPPFFGASYRLGRGLDRIRLFGCFNRDRGVCRSHLRCRG